MKSGFIMANGTTKSPDVEGKNNAVHCLWPIFDGCIIFKWIIEDCTEEEQKE